MGCPVAGRRSVTWMVAGALALVATAGLTLLSFAGAQGAANSAGSREVQAAAIGAQQTLLFAPSGSPGDQFGSAVALSGDTAVVGVPMDSRLGEYAGAAYVFVRTSAGWTLDARLSAADASGYARFGYSVAVSGATVVVGAAFGDAAYVFVRDGTGWSQQAKLTASDGVAGDRFGQSVAVDGDTALVGDYWGNAAYAFTRVGTDWTQQAKLTAADAGSGRTFGTSIALDGDTAVVGDQWWGTAGGVNDPLGAAYVFTRTGGAWTQQARLTASDGSHGDYLGASVALRGDTALVGTGQGTGAGYVFTRAGSSWSQQAELRASDGNAYDCFGTSVALTANRALVGSPYSDLYPWLNDNAGAAYVFTHSGSTWTQEAKLMALDGSPGDNFGKAVALADASALVGSPMDDVGSSVQLIDQGSAYAIPLDTVAPHTVATFTPAANAAGWRRTPVTLTLTATDAGSGVDQTWYQIGSTPPAVYHASTRPVIATNGVIRVRDYSVDRAGNTEAATTSIVRIDTGAPATRALADLTVRRRHRVTFTFRVDDAVSPTATVIVRVYRRGTVKASLSLGRRATNTNLSYRYVCGLRAGRYTWKVLAVDLAGNPQRQTGQRALVVR